MYIRTTKRQNKNGSVTEYLQLAHNEWDKKTNRSTVKVLLNLGRKENVDAKGLERLVTSIKKALGTMNLSGGTNATTSDTHTSIPDMEILSSKSFGGCWLLDQLWKRLGIDDEIKRLLSDKGYEIPIERSLLAMTANRAVDPSSKLSTEYWVNNETYIEGLTDVSVHQLYRSMDFLVEHEAAIQEAIFFSVANVMNLEVDLIYFDTTSTYFEAAPDELESDVENGEAKNNDYTLRQYGYSKDKRPDLPQIIIGMAVTKEGIPVRCWVFSGETADMSMVEQVKKDLNGWRLNRVIWVMDRGFSSEESCIKLQRGGGHYIMGEKMRSGKPDIDTILSKRGPYTPIREDLSAKEVIVGDGERRRRYAVVVNQKEAVKDRATREKHLRTLEDKLNALSALKKKEHTKAVCALVAHPVYGRYIKLLAGNTPVIDKAKVASEERLDGKYIIKTSDDTLSLEDIVLGYKQLHDIERGFRVLKSELELRPIYHRKSDRIKAHVLLCWLALLMIRIVEIDTGMTWFHVRRLLGQVNLVIVKMKEGTVQQCTVLSEEQNNLFAACKVTPPPKVVDLKPF